MKKLISLISSLAIIVGMFSTVAFADADGTIDLSVGVDAENYYYVDVLFDIPDVNLDVVKTKTENRVDYYTGTGVLGGQFDITGITSSDFYQVLSGVGVPASANVTAEGLTVILKADAVKDMAAEDASGSATVVRLGTNYTSDAKTPEEIKDMFSTMSLMNVKITTVNDAAGSSNPALNTIVTYASFDGNYGLAFKTDEPTTATVVGDYTGDKVEEGDAADTTDKAVAILGTPAAPESRATSLVWSVTDTSDVTKTFTQEVDVEGGATYTFGLVLRNITADLVKTVAAVLQ